MLNLSKYNKFKSRVFFYFRIPTVKGSLGAWFIWPQGQRWKWFFQINTIFENEQDFLGTMVLFRKKMVDKRLGMFIELKKRLFVKNERKNKNEHFESVQRYERNFLFYFK